jgi:hypothetical protein
MTADEAARIFAALEHDDVRWIEQDHVATFYPRNPDKEDATAPERDRRRKDRKWCRRELMKRREQGGLDEEQHGYALALLKVMTDAELGDFKARLRRGVALEAILSTSHGGHAVAVRGFVEATPRAQQTRADLAPVVDNSGTATRGKAAGLPMQDAGAAPGLSTEQAELWLAGEGIKFLVERLHERRPKAETLMARWRRDLDDDPVVTATLIAGLAERPLNLARLELLVTEFIRRRRDAQQKGEPLPLPPVRNFGTDPLKPTSPQAPGHGVAVAGVDNPAAEQPSRRCGTDG